MRPLGDIPSIYSSFGGLSHEHCNVTCCLQHSEGCWLKEELQKIYPSLYEASQPAVANVIN